MPPAPPTGPARSTRSSVRGGGPRRRGGGPGRVDRDGDLDMGAGLSSSNGITKRSSSSSSRTSTARGRGAPRGGGNLKALVAAQDKVLRHLGATGSELSNRVSALSKKSSGYKTLKVDGLSQSKAFSNPDRGQRAALEFLERKTAHLASRRVTIKKSHMPSDSSTLYVQLSKEDAEDMIKVNGWLFAGATLTITESETGFPSHASAGSSSTQLSQETQETRGKLEGFLSQRYDPTLKLLNLSALGQDPLLVEMQLFQEKERAEKSFKVFMAIVEGIFPDPVVRRDAVESVSLANNALEYVGPVFDLAITFPDLKHLDLGGNNLKNVKSLGRWSHRLQSLETLLLTGNPIETAEPTYKEELLKWWPKLQNLSGNLVRTPGDIAAVEAAKAAARPTPIPQHGPDFRDTAGIGEQFLMGFLPRFDNDRAGLAATFYDDNSHFSVSVVNASHSRDTDPHSLSWAPYIKFSRNLTKISHPGTRVQRLMKGRQSIQDLWKMLPATKHPELPAEFTKYIVDCHPLPALADPTGQSAVGVDGLAITVHGEFDEIEANSGKIGKRSFSRAFVLGPSAPGAAVPVRVVSDILTLRAWTAIPDVHAAAAPSVVAPAADQTHQQQQQQLVAELSRRTNMTPQFSEMCLAEVNWNLEQAMVKFEAAKSVLGPDAFLGGTPLAAVGPQQA